MISGNAGPGVVISGSGTTTNVVAGNLIGTDITGTVAIANDGDGVVVDSSLSVAGARQHDRRHTAGAGNLISGNTANGVLIDSVPSDTVVEGNKIGTDISGTVALANNRGVAIFSRSNTIGGTAAGAGNLISGNTNAGIEIVHGYLEFIQGNLIGTDSGGTVALGNGTDGVLLEEKWAPSNTAAASTTSASSTTATSSGQNVIGGTGTGAGDVISGNPGNGVYITAPAPRQLRRGRTHRHRCDRDGRDGQRWRRRRYSRALHGQHHRRAHSIQASARATSSPATKAMASNSAVHKRRNLVEGNLIGLDVTGTVALGNNQGGVSGVYAGGVWIDGGSGGNTIGGLTATPGTGAGNVISGNLEGVVIYCAGSGNVMSAT